MKCGPMADSLVPIRASRKDDASNAWCRAKDLFEYQLRSGSTVGVIRKFGRLGKTLACTNQCQMEAFGIVLTDQTTCLES